MERAQDENAQLWGIGFYCMPVYNTEKYLENCIDSVLCQSFKELEVICFDDGFTDASLQILQKYAPNDRRVSLIKGRHVGAVVARNLGMKGKKGNLLSKNMK